MMSEQRTTAERDCTPTLPCGNATGSVCVYELVPQREWCRDVHGGYWCWHWCWYWHWYWYSMVWYWLVVLVVLENGRMRAPPLCAVRIAPGSVA